MLRKTGLNAQLGSEHKCAPKAKQPTRVDLGVIVTKKNDFTKMRAKTWYFPPYSTLCARSPPPKHVTHAHTDVKQRPRFCT